MKRLFFISLITIVLSENSVAQKIVTSFWDCQFGLTSEQVYQNLTKAELSPIVGDDAIYLQNNSVYGISFQVIGLKFTAEDAFYNIFGYNKFDNKQDANAEFNNALARLKERYPNVQTMSRPEGCLKLYAYADADAGTAFSLGLYKSDEGKFFVRLNVFSDYLLKRANN